MRYFDNIYEAPIKEGNDGEIIYFPYGALGKGYVVDDPERKEKISRFHGRLSRYVAPFCILYGVAVGLSIGVSISVFIPLILILILVALRQRLLIKGLLVSREKMSITEEYIANAKRLSTAFLVGTLINGVICIILGALTPLLLRSSFEQSLGVILVTIFFVVGILSIAGSLFFLKLKRSAKAPKNDT